MLAGILVVLPAFRILFDPDAVIRGFTTISPNAEMTLYLAFYCSTIFTSIWLAFIVISSTVLKLLAPLHRFTAWFFDVEKHPLEAVGIVAGTLVIVGAATGTIIHKL